jgi:hypothetical protein
MDKSLLFILFVAFTLANVLSTCDKNRVLVRHKAENKALEAQIDSLTTALDVCVGGIE